MAESVENVELMCCESECIKRAYNDPVLLNDDRVLGNLLATEDRYVPTSLYFKYVQTDIQPCMRKMVAQWMLEVCEEQRCEEDVFPLSMNYLDRFLSLVDIHRTRLQLLAAACMFLASKLKETIPLTAEKLVRYTDNSITLRELMDMELLVLNKLKWDLSAITAHDFLEQIMTRLHLDQVRSDIIKRHSQTFIALCAAEVTFMFYPPSMIAAASIAAAIHGLSRDHLDVNVLYKLHKITRIDIDCLRGCQEQIERALSADVDEQTADPNRFSPTSKTNDPSEQPTTPTDVRDIQI